MKPKFNSTPAVPQMGSNTDREEGGHQEVKLQNSKFIIKPLSNKDLK